ncbi:putative glutathione S-transferase kappa 1 [Mollisia scopiformis]|uniref:Glutathione S-transferase kappa 1 n=1 Tax=Mollisia scopiformis TaxID=149040 RepID=A0A194WZ08_MOLSC|nr:putative glutathione S-transferase kappa 1 [Mollisia scopiformis]KUJ12832.1 putative glutathione S-transferase kappa 1 [Mollisia scopiformis]
MGGHIDCYLDCASFYGVIAFNYLLKNRDLLAGHDVSVEFHPVFLGGINVGSGNKPPWTLLAKAKYGQFDGDRAKKYHSMQNISAPSFFPPLTLLPQRALCYIKATFPPSTFERTWSRLFNALWIDHINITIPSDLSSVLASTRIFSEEEVECIMKATGEKEWKDKLLANTEKVLEQGAFGAPWFWVRSGEGREEPFFGSDRFHFMWEFLGIPWRDIAIIPKGTEKAKL